MAFDPNFDPLKPPSYDIDPAYGLNNVNVVAEQVIASPKDSYTEQKIQVKDQSELFDDAINYLLKEIAKAETSSMALNCSKAVLHLTEANPYI